MVSRTEAKTFEEFSGKVLDVTIEPSTLNPEEDQYHIQIKPLDIEIKGRTGLMHDWIRIPPTATAESVPEGSVIDLYIRELEACDKKVKALDMVNQVFLSMKGKTFKFVKGKLGKAFDGKQAADHWLPRTELENGSVKAK